MKLNLKRLFLVMLLAGMFFPCAAQKGNAGPGSKKYPASFTISGAELQDLLSKPARAQVRNKSNKYIDKGTVVKNISTGDMHFLRLKLKYFSTAYLTVQVNGEYSTQVFVLSYNKSVFYKGKIENGNVVMTKCEEDEIVSE